MKLLVPDHAGLRAHDVHQGLVRVNRGAGLVARELRTTQLIGMAAALATAIKGRDLISSGPDLRQVAADQLDIDAWAFEQVVDVLEEVSYVRNRKQTAGETRTFYETVPEDFGRLYRTLGEEWEARKPGEVEKSLLAIVDDLSFGPRRIAELDIDPRALSPVSQLGEAAEAVRIHRIGEEHVAYSPFFAYEHPESMGELLETADVEAVRKAFEATRAYQGLPLSKDEHGETARALVGAGLLAGPSLERPDGSLETFSVAPYGLSSDLLTLRRPVLDRALALLAAVRMGEHFGGVTSLYAPAALLRKLLDPDQITARHSSSRRQYAVLQRMGVVRFAGSADRAGIVLIDTDDNREAVRLAIDLISHGEAMAAKVSELAHQGLTTEGVYRPPVQAIQPAREVRRLPSRLFENLVESAMGRRPIE